MRLRFFFEKYRFVYLFICLFGNRWGPWAAVHITHMCIWVLVRVWLKLLLFFKGTNTLIKLMRLHNYIEYLHMATCLVLEITWTDQPPNEWESAKLFSPNGSWLRYSIKLYTGNQWSAERTPSLWSGDQQWNNTRILSYFCPHILNMVLHPYLLG